MGKNEYMQGQEWIMYDPYEWIMVPSNRMMFHDRNHKNLSKNESELRQELDWDHMRTVHEAKQLELTISRDPFVKELAQSAAEAQADVIINKELAHFMGWS